MSRSILSCVGILVCLGAMPLAAQDAVLGQLYGSGVHAYFGQDYLKAHQLLASAVDGRTQDPRAFYFRGLTLLKLGRPQEAEIDFQRGAKLESAIDPTRAYNVARSLERVQGSDRATLEQYRLEARMTVLKKAEDERRARYEENAKEQRAFLQKQSEGGPAKAVEGPGEAAKSPDVVEPPKSPAPPAAGDPFSLDKAAGPNKDDGSKKAEPPALPPGGETPAENPAAKPDGGADPLALPAAAKPAAPAANPVAPPPVAKKPDAGIDPFGGTPDAAKPAAPVVNPVAPPPAAKKPDAASDPFGGAPDAARPAAPAVTPEKKPTGKADNADDPFGAPATDAKPAAPAAPAADANTAAPARPAKRAPPIKAEEKKPSSDDPFGG